MLDGYSGWRCFWRPSGVSQAAALVAVSDQDLARGATVIGRYGCALIRLRSRASRSTPRHHRPQCDSKGVIPNTPSSSGVGGVVAIASIGSGAPEFASEQVLLF